MLFFFWLSNFKTSFAMFCWFSKDVGSDFRILVIGCCSKMVSLFRIVDGISAASRADSALITVE